jgi:hypothetical protein
MFNGNYCNLASCYITINISRELFRIIRMQWFYCVLCLTYIDHNTILLHAAVLCLSFVYQIPRTHSIRSFQERVVIFNNHTKIREMLVMLIASSPNCLLRMIHFLQSSLVSLLIEIFWTRVYEMTVQHIR